MSAATALDPSEFRRALGSFATGVTIITTRDGQGAPVGLTANSFNSVSLDPPMVLWSLAKTSRCLPAFEHTEHWAVHILSADQEALSNRFAKSGEDKFGGIPVEEGVAGLPLLTGCATRLQCRTSFRYEGGDHIIFVGEVLRFDRRDCAPLVFQAGAYAVAMRKPPAAIGEPALRGANFVEDFLGYLLARSQQDLYTRVRALHQAKGLDDEQFYLLSSAVVWDGPSLADLDRLFAASGRQLSSRALRELVDRGLVQRDPQDATRLRVTPQGRDLGLHLMAAIKAVESALLEKMGTWEALSLKALLQQFLRVADAGLPRVS